MNAQLNGVLAAGYADSPEPAIFWDGLERIEDPNNFLSVCRWIWFNGRRSFTKFIRQKLAKDSS